MSEPVIPLNSPEGRLVEAAMDAGDETEWLLSRADADAGGAAQAPQRPSFAELYAYANGGAAPANLLQALTKNADVACDFQRLLENRAAVHFPRAAAASTGAMEQRQVPGARMFLRPSRADDDQVYLIVALDDPASAPTTMIALRVDQPPERAVLPAFKDGRAQLLLDKSSALVQAFQDVNAEIYLT